jgi:hypothetical protein
VDASPRFSRLFPLLPLLISAIALIGTLPAAASAAPVEARTAASFVDSIGVNTHTYYSDTVYAQDFGTVAQRLQELGVHHIRENLVPDRPDQYERLNQLAAAGIGSTLILGDPTNGSRGLERLRSILDSDLQGSIDAVEGPNEFDLSGDPGWAARIASYQAELYAAVKSDPQLSALPVIGPSLGYPGNREAALDLSPYLDYGNIHSYPDGEPPEANITEWLEAAPSMSGSKPVMATETGYHNALASTGAQRPVSEAAAAAYLPRLFLQYFRLGVARTFPYELVDEFPDPGLVEPESDFGLLRNDLTPKPAFAAISNLIAILEDPGGEFAPQRLQYTLAGDRAQLSQLLLEKSDGRFYLALWRAGSVWDPENRTALRPGSAPVELSFATPPQSVRAYVPNASSAPDRSLPLEAGSTSVQVGPRAVILEIQPG